MTETEKEILVILAEVESYSLTSDELVGSAQALIATGKATLVLDALRIAYYAGARAAHRVNIERLSDAVTGCDAKIKLLAMR